MSCGTAVTINNNLTTATNVITTSTQTAINIPSASATTTTTSNIQNIPSSSGINTATNVLTIPVPIVSSEELYAYVCVKGSLHDRSCSVFGLNETEVQAIVKRFENSVKPLVNGVMVSVTALDLINSLAQLGYKVVTSCGEAEISWTMQREI